MLCLFFINGYAQDILLDDVNYIHPMEDYEYLFDTLSAHGLNIHFVSEEGWGNLINMDAIWIGDAREYYNYETKTDIQNYSRNGGKIFVGKPNGEMMYINDFLMDFGWRTTLSIYRRTPGDLGHYDTTCYILPLQPLTDEIELFVLENTELIDCGYNAFPFAFYKCDPYRVVAAISYPFLHEGNCSSYVIILTGIHSWETRFEIIPENYRFATNIFLTACGVEGYELEPCQRPIGSYCERVPNPFTPNGDGINDYAQFLFYGLEIRTATIYIYNIHGHEVKQINVPEGANAKASAQWDGKDNNRNPLPQGVYLYVIENGGEIVCEGTVCIAR